MCEPNNDEKLDLFLKLAEIKLIGSQMVEGVRSKNSKMGIPLVYSCDDKIFYELADGTITNMSPFENSDKKTDENKNDKP